MSLTPKRNGFAFGSATQINSPSSSHLLDYTGLDPSLTIKLKGLGKRDVTTRVKASDDLLLHLQSDAPLGDEDAFLTAWCHTYPTCAIDVDRRIRINAHQITGITISRYRKKTVQYLEYLAPPWLLGEHDVDKGVTRAAREALELCFKSEQKQAEFRALFAHAVKQRGSEYAFDTAAETLSDARFVNADDSLAKYSNVVAAALQALSLLPYDHQEVLSNETYWQRLNSDDSCIQSAALQWLASIVDSIPQAEISSNASLANGLSSVLTHILPNNMIQLITILHATAIKSPAMIFEDKLKIKKPLTKRLLSLIKRNATAITLTASYWSDLANLLALAANLENAPQELLTSLLITFAEAARNSPKVLRSAALEATALLSVRFFGQAHDEAKSQLMKILQVDADIKDVRKYLTVLKELHEVDSTVLDNVLDALAGRMSFPVEECLGTILDFLNLVASLSLDDKLHSIQQQIVQDLLRSSSDDSRMIPIFRSILSYNFRSAASEQRAQFVHDHPLSAYSHASDTALLLADINTQDQERCVNGLLEAHCPQKEDLLQALHEADIARPIIRSWLATTMGSPGPRSQSFWTLLYSSIVADPDLSLLQTVPAEVRTSHPSEYFRIVCKSIDNIPSQLEKHISAFKSLLGGFWNALLTEESAKQAYTCLQRMHDDGQLKQCLQVSIIDAALSLNGPKIQLLVDSVPQDFLQNDTEWIGLLVDANAKLPDEIRILHPLGELTTFLTGIEHRSYDNEGYSAILRYTLLVRGQTRCDSSTLLSLVACMIQIADLLPGPTMIYDILDHAHRARLDGLVEDAEITIKEIGARIRSSKVLEEASLPNDRTSTRSFCEAVILYKALSNIMAETADPTLADTLYTQALKTKNQFAIIASTYALKEFLTSSKSADHRRNKLASELSAQNPPDELYNRCTELAAVLMTGSISRQRAINLIRNLLTIIQKAQIQDLIIVPAFQIITLLLDNVKSEYGSFWQGLIRSALSLLDTAISANNQSAQYVILRFLSWFTTNSEGNDDLQDYWLDASKQFSTLIVRELLHCDSHANDDQAALLCSLVAARLLRGISYTLLDQQQRSLLSGLLASAEHVQSTAYTILDSCIEQEREAIIVDAALVKETEELDIALPSELLSLVLDAPFTDEEDMITESEAMLCTFRGYCLAWQLLFKHFPGSPLRLRAKFASDLEELGLVHDLLAFVLITLRVDEQRPIDISRFSKTTFDTGFRDGLQELQSYAAHLFHLCLLYVPGPVRTWWMDCSDRNLVLAVEALTEKHYSLALIQADVQSIQSADAKRSLNDNNLDVKVSNGGKDIVTTYEIDDQKMEMVIHMPANYPLRKVHIEGLQRVGVKDAQWRAWLLASQSVLTAQNGSLLDAISLFQRNISLHFEGVAECAICFSILSVQDKSLPSKRCATCKNLFHGSCLYKWFKSSSQSRCPLCRNSFAF